MPEGQGGAGGSLIELEGYGEGWAVPAADEESGVLRGEFENLWPLQLVDLNDEEMVGTLFRLLRRLPQVCFMGFLLVCVLLSYHTFWAQVYMFRCNVIERVCARSVLRPLCLVGCRRILNVVYSR